MLKNKGTLTRLLEYAKPYRAYLILSFLFSVIFAAANLYTPIIIGDGVDLIVSAGNVDFESLKFVLFRFIAVILIMGVSQWLMGLCTNKVTYNTIKDIRFDVFCKLERVPIKYIDQNPHGDLLSRIINDAEQIQDGLLLGFSQLFSGIVTILATIGFMLKINFYITLVVVLLTPISLFVASFITKSTYNMHKIQSKTRGELSGFVEEMITSQKVVKAFAYEQKAQERFDEINERLKKCGLAATFFSSTVNPSTRFVNGLVYTATGIAGALFAIAGRISVGQLSAFLTYANQYTKPFNEISGVIAELQSSFACAKRVFDTIDEKEEEKDPDNAITLNGENGKNQKTVNGNVEFKNVCFSYSKDTSLIENLNLKATKGQKIAIVGPTGSGKTTLINLLMRFYDVDSGQILVSDIPVKEIKKKSLRSSFGMVLQDTFLKSGTIRENIAFGKKDATMEEIIEAAKSAYAHSFIKRLPKGYDTVVCDEDENISVGEKQLIQIARVMLTKPKMLILDEATSSIDTITEIKIQKAFEKMMEGKTAFIAAHRLSTIKEADIILVMDKGKIIEQGSHEELLKKGGFYKKLYESQFETY